MQGEEFNQPRAPTRLEGGILEIRRVLVSTDFSVLGNTAIPYAYAMLANGGQVWIVHVETPPEIASPIHAHDPTLAPSLLVQRAEQFQRRRERLRELVPAGAATRGIVTEVELVQDANPAAGICRAADRLDAHVVCLASHGHSGLSTLLFGSVASAVLRTIHCPVLVVRTATA